MCFFISWGARTEARDLGQMGQYHCERCGKDGPFHAVLSYRVRHVYWLFRWVTGKERSMVCGNCHAAYPADREDFGVAEEREAIPFFDRRGWTIGAGALASLVGVGFVATAADNQENQRFLADPKVGDIYELDMAMMLKKPEQAHMFSALRVVAVKPDAIEFQIGNMYYDRVAGVDEDVRAGKTRQPDYYMKDGIGMARAAVKKMFADGALANIERER